MQNFKLTKQSKRILAKKKLEAEICIFPEILTEMPPAFVVNKLTYH